MLGSISTLVLIATMLITVPAFAEETAGQGSPRYPTADEAYYVLACMEMNGQNADGLHKCSCAINAVEARLPYQEYSDAELVMAMRQAGSRNAAIFRDAEPMKEIVSKFLRAQSLANQQCFGSATVQPPSDAPNAK